MKATLRKPAAVFISLIACGFIAQAQSALPYVLASTGGGGTMPGGATLNFTLGEPFVATIGANPRFTQGFQQPSTSGTPLPVHLLDFSGIARNEYNFLIWHTAQEKNSDYFDVERSQDGIAFRSIGRVYSSAVNGSSNEKRAYTFPDKTMPAGTNYYRLKQVDRDGQSSYSFIISLDHTNTQQSGFTLSPNPTKGKVYFSVASITDQSFLQINDISGKEIKFLKLTAITTEIDLDGLAGGTYFIRYIDGQNSAWAKVIKE
ncbi:T9SS type A sorting domain-containing protein [Taibaiella koreensis]|uniref:T9SS type A sorting domain-containing protein n=1 Tax=Taibaiella koreensis TaxID=1268548 RepID=UPI000E5A03A3|nr:T9SS type A sorting domain-containing protein [Taibaiella koreensis]